VNGGQDLYEVKNATIAFLSRLWEENYKKNLPYFAKTPSVDKLFGRFKNMPAIVVGAGPSLDRNIKYLQLGVGKALIIACDTAVQILFSNGIKPDIVLNLDPQPSVMNFFESIDSKNIALVAPTIAYPELREKWRGDFFFYNKNAPDIPLLAQISLNHKNIGKLTPGGSVLSVAFDMAFQGGCNPIAFVGQDLSYPADKAYASGSHFGRYESETIFDIHDGQITQEEDIFGRTLKTQKSMAVTNQWFNWAFSTWNKDGKRKIYNCSESGILKGCEISTLAEFVANNCNKKINFSWAIKKVAR